MPGIGHQVVIVYTDGAFETVASIVPSISTSDMESLLSDLDGLNNGFG